MGGFCRKIRELRFPRPVRIDRIYCHQAEILGSKVKDEETECCEVVGDGENEKMEEERAGEVRGVAELLEG